MQYRAFHPEVSRSNPFQIRSDQQLLNVCFQICRKDLHKCCFYYCYWKAIYASILQNLLIYVIHARHHRSECFINVQKYEFIYIIKIRVVTICSLVSQLSGKIKDPIDHS